MNVRDSDCGVRRLRMEVRDEMQEEASMNEGIYGHNGAKVRPQQ